MRNGKMVCRGVIAVRSLFAGCAALLFATTSANAIPALQLGPDPSNPGAWSYDAATQTWVTSGAVASTFKVLTTANATTGNGDYAWEPAGSADQTAYLIISTVPDVGPGDQFDVTVENDALMVSLFDAGYGVPPLEDPNSIAPHGIFDTYFEIYEFEFNGAVTTIKNTQPADSGMGDGFEEVFEITVNALQAGVTGLHMDLFTVVDDGTYTPGQLEDKHLVKSVAPFSHDAEYEVGPGGPGPGPAPAPLPSGVPEPVTATMGVMAMAALSATLRRRR